MSVRQCLEIWKIIKLYIFPLSQLATYLQEAWSASISHRALKGSSSGSSFSCLYSTYTAYEESRNPNIESAFAAILWFFTSCFLLFGVLVVVCGCVVLCLLNRVRFVDTRHGTSSLIPEPEYNVFRINHIHCFVQNGQYFRCYIFTKFNTKFFNMWMTSSALENS